MKQYIDIFGKSWETECMGCAISNRELDVPGGILYETELFQLHQDPTNPIPGFLIISIKRHVSSFLEFTHNEKKEFPEILYKARSALEYINGIKFCTIIQEERAPHFHTWILPYYEWMEEIKHGTIDSIIPLLQYSKQNWKTEEGINEVINTAKNIKLYFEKHI